MNQPSPEPASLAVPGRTAPTWEVELLISGVAVFAMLQLSGHLDDALFTLRPRLDAAWHQPLGTMQLYLKAATVILALTFSIHLLLRAYWIALVGMNSVYPEGVRWDRLRMGPIQRRLEQAHSGDPLAVIDRADNRATTVFALGVAFASTLLCLTLLVGLVMALVQGALVLAGIRADPSLVFLACLGVAIAPIMISPLVDRWFGPRLQPGRPAHAIIAGVFAFYAMMGLRSTNIIGLVASHGGERRTSVLVMGVLVSVMFGVIMSLEAAEAPERVGNYGDFPALDALPGRSVVDAHYDLRRDVTRDPAVPYIQDPVVTGPYLRLTVPFIPGEDSRAMRERCGPADPDAPGLAIDCLQSLHVASIDGKPVPGLHYDAGTDPRSDRPALVAMLDVRALAPGRHELRVARARHDEDEPADWIIPFWR